MASGEGLLERVRAAPHGHSQSDFFRLLEYYGFTQVRRARHGAIYRHSLLDNHVDASVRQLMIPTGNSLPGYVGRKAVKAIDALAETKRKAAEKQEADDAQ